MTPYIYPHEPQMVFRIHQVSNGKYIQHQSRCLMLFLTHAKFPFSSLSSFIEYNEHLTTCSKIWQCLR